ncbi:MULTISPECIES: potassium-transporting ATPase subunit F [unclassified Meiothermus]|nr:MULTISPECIES: potassium-transporting ATPase subunit F [unclassified Meiothermus]PZA06922.1 potassium ABC transporter ATPase [Meiothermus sp. Pnk-1]RYM38317.1 potassium-transporting ATPase subunit F [Meiothermus sp. PNK-Is4]
MSPIEYAVVGFIALALMVYLVYVIVSPKRF